MTSDVPKMEYAYIFSQLNFHPVIRASTESVKLNLKRLHLTIMKITEIWRNKVQFYFGLDMFF